VKTFKELAIRLFNIKEPLPSARLANVVHTRQRQVQYYLSGRDPTPEHIVEIVEKQIAAVEQFDLKARVDQLVAEASAAGIDKEIIGHYLATAVESPKD